MKKLFMVCLAAVLLLGAGRLHAQDTEYKATPVTISRDKVRENGKLYYSHVVLERQTLFSIAKAYPSRTSMTPIPPSSLRPKA